MVFNSIFFSMNKKSVEESSSPTSSFYWRITLENHTPSYQYYCIGDIELYDGATLLSANSTSNAMANTNATSSDPALTNMTEKISLTGFDLWGETNNHNLGHLKNVINTEYTSQSKSYFYNPHSPHKLVFAFNENKNITDIILRNIQDADTSIHSNITKVERWDGTQYVTMGQSGTNAGASGGTTTYSISAPPPTTSNYWKIIAEWGGTGTAPRYTSVGDIELWEGSTLVSENNTTNNMTNTEGLSGLTGALSGMERSISLTSLDLYAVANKANDSVHYLRSVVDTNLGYSQCYWNDAVSSFSPSLEFVFAFNSQKTIDKVVIVNSSDNNDHFCRITGIEVWDGIQYVSAMSSFTENYSHTASARNEYIIPPTPALYSYLRIETQTKTNTTGIRNLGEIELYDSTNNLLSDNNTTHHDTQNYTHTAVTGLSSPLNNMTSKYDNSSASSPFNLYTNYSPHSAPYGNISHLIDTITSDSQALTDNHQKPAYWYSGGNDGIIFEFLNNQSVDRIVFKTLDDDGNATLHSKVTKVYGWNGSSWIDLTPSNISSWDTGNHATNTITGLNGGTPELNP